MPSATYKGSVNIHGIGITKWQYCTSHSSCASPKCGNRGSYSEEKSLLSLLYGEITASSRNHEPSLGLKFSKEEVCVGPRSWRNLCNINRHYKYAKIIPISCIADFSPTENQTPVSTLQRFGSSLCSQISSVWTY